MAIISLSLFFSCTKTSTPYIDIESEQVTIESDGAGVSIKVNSNCNWSLTTDQDWIKVKRNSAEGKLIISASKNLTPEDRNGSVTLKGDGVSKTVKVLQKQLNSISVDGTTSIKLNEEAHQLSFKVLFNTPFEVNIPKEADWLSLVDGTKAMQSKELQFYVKSNDSKNGREAIVSLTAEKCEPLKIIIYQTGRSQTVVFTVSSVERYPIPLLENKGNSATVESEGQTQDYKAGTYLNVNSESEFIIHSPEIQSVHFTTVEGLDAIDFSGCL